MQNFQNGIDAVDLREIHESATSLSQWRFLRIKRVCALIGVSRSTVYNWINQNSRWHVPAFPKPFKIGKTVIGWREDEVIAYLAKAQRAGGAS